MKNILREPLIILKKPNHVDSVILAGELQNVSWIKFHALTIIVIGMP